MRQWLDLRVAAMTELGVRLARAARPAAVVPTLARLTGRGDVAELRALLELGAGSDEYAAIASPRDGILYANAFDEEMIDLQAPRLDALRSKPLYPYLWLYGGDVAGLASKRRALERHGFDGFFLWCWSSDPESTALERLGDAMTCKRMHG